MQFSRGLLWWLCVGLFIATSAANFTCKTAHLKCAIRVGCGRALQNYLVNCADLMSGRVRRCSDMCQKALIALISTDEGEQLMRCDCEGEKFCEQTKQRVEMCRPEVMKANEAYSVVSCPVAQWICQADPVCSTAVEYYRRLCRSMFHGHKCSLRCNNSIAILNRQEKAAKLKTCLCDGSEDYDCPTIKLNMERLCFHKTYPKTRNEGTPNEVQKKNELERHRSIAKSVYSSSSRVADDFVLAAILIFIQIFINSSCR